MMRLGEGFYNTSGISINETFRKEISSAWIIELLPDYMDFWFIFAALGFCPCLNLCNWLYYDSSTNFVANRQSKSA